MGPAQQRAPGPPRYATRGNSSVSGHGREKGITPPNARLMPDSRAIDAERPMQLSFSKIVGKSVVYWLGSSLLADLLGDLALELADLGAELVVVCLQQPIV